MDCFLRHIIARCSKCVNQEFLLEPLITHLEVLLASELWRPALWKLICQFWAILTSLVQSSSVSWMV